MTEPADILAISRILRKAGFTAADHYRDSEGYRVTWAFGREPAKSVRVRFCALAAPKAHAAVPSPGPLAGAALVLTACGYTVEMDERDPHLIVTSKAAS